MMKNGGMKKPEADRTKPKADNEERVAWNF
jgi:hypothetical protein